ncbi:polyisoprenoid-binding protein [Niastella koreensis]|uniref:YceI family protein n=2 Tax=Niastella koreensis TaxID=354356 RepID=G8TF96_NIAKG|nr:YceI family protein [Niastella koreensis]AEV97306.1 YceI family protein [Niastella koreensis GR20-10]OQP39024.1 polyisoprenoid-binding protein [Niastella koreensis]
MKNRSSMAIIAALLFSFQLKAQNKFITRTGSITFFSSSGAENIDAVNNEAFSLVDFTRGEVAFQVLITGFKFKKALMEEHFNENYMESTKFPKAVFQGTIADLSKLNLKNNGTVTVNVTGNLTMHGVTKQVTIPATINVQGSKLSASSKFDVQLHDYNIKVPSLVSKQVAESVAVTVNCAYEPYTK